MNNNIVDLGVYEPDGTPFGLHLFSKCKRNGVLSGCHLVVIQSLTSQIDLCSQ